ncbi:MAG TPA: hypothetical protein VFW74_06905, partial [Acidimicrobiia bacterium]|nr:hypothetical protein [Acidimicrobiia bacterium]
VMGGSLAPRSGCRPDCRWDTESVTPSEEGRPIDGIQEVQSRIAQIQALVAQFTAAPSAPASSGSALAGGGDATSSVTGAGQAFATALGNVQGTPNQTQWANDFLTRLGMPVTSENMRAVVAWEKAEGTKAQFNPLATTRSMPGATNFNQVGVKNFASYQDGIDANAAALMNGRYPNILAALRRGDSAEAVGQAIANSPWGTGDGVLRVLRSS